MKNEMIHEEVFDVILKHAAADSFRRELDELEKESEAYRELQPTAAQKKSARKAYKQAMRKKVGAAVVWRRIAVAVLVLFCLSSAVMLTAPTVRAAVFDSISEFFHKYVLIHFAAESQEIQLGEYTLSYLPEEYTLVESKEKSTRSRYVFSNGSDELILECIQSSLSDLNMDSESRRLQKMEISGVPAFAFVSENEQQKTILAWGNSKESFLLSGKLPIAELSKIAKSLSVSS